MTEPKKKPDPLEKVTVSKKALQQVLQAFANGGYEVAELQLLTNNGIDNPVLTLIEECNSQIQRNEAP